MEQVGGYRLVRRLGSGVRADIHLGHAGSADPPNEERVAAIKVFRAGATADSIETEIAALTRSQSRHLLELRDLALAPDGKPCLILPRLGSGSLGRVLARRHVISAGEAVTILVPIVTAVAELHRVGVAHGAVNAGSVLFDSRGAPVLARFGAAIIVGDRPGSEDGRSLTPAAEEENGWLAEDRRSLRALIATVLDRIGDSTDAALARSGGLKRPDRFPRDLAAHDGRPLEGLPLDRRPLDTGARDEVVAALFDLAPAAAIRFDDSPRDEAPPMPIPARLGPAEPPPAEPTRVDPLGVDSLGVEPLGVALTPGATSAADETGRDKPRQGAARPVGPGGLAALRLRDLTERATGTGLDENPLGALRTGFIRSIRTVRRPVWIAGGAGLCALVLALTVVPSALPAEPSASESRTAGAASPATSAPPSAASPPAPLPGSTSAKGTTDTTKTGPAKRSPTDDSGAGGDDPATAAVALIATRRACLEQRSASCLDRVDQKDSAVMDADLHLLRTLSARADIPTEASLAGMVPGLVQRLGDTAIVQFGSGDGIERRPETNPASLLLIRSEAGWRIRDLTFG
ncbi:MAG: eukaryotic-like serine/threonine-protein kinase [Microbacteriaceae bacterium]|nr:eukaryotic-like serine/threonine-protein kinase [Microbacteriaceae bacterium]